MKILHTSDWHLGAKIEGKDRLEEQEKVLDEIIRVSFDYDVQIVIIAGDVFHTKTPSSEAEDLFFKTVERLSDNGNRLVFVLSGNHDDPLRLGAGRPLAEKFNIILATELDSVNILKTKVDARARIIDAGRGFVKVKCGEEYASIGFLPYFGSEKIKELANSETYPVGVKKICETIDSNFNLDSLNIFVGHLFLVGGKVGGVGEIRVGESLAISEDDLPQKAHYKALGHLHSAQKIGEDCFYSGTITNLRAKDDAPQVNIIVGDKNGVTDVKHVVLKNALRVCEIVANNIAVAYQKVNEAGPNALVYLTINQQLGLKADDLRALRQQFPNIISVKLKINSSSSEQLSEIKLDLLSDRELFVEFYKSINGANPPEDLVNLFLECRGENNASN